MRRNFNSADHRTLPARVIARLSAFAGRASLAAQVTAVHRSKSSPLMSELGHSRPMRSKPRERVCPLLPESRQIADRLGMSA
jgi:hypothetical protein